MQAWKRLLRWLKNPVGPWLYAVFLLSAAIVGGAAALLIIRPIGLFYDVLSYAAYLLSVLALGYSVYAAICLVRRHIVVLNGKHKIVHKVVKDYEFRTHLFAVLSLLTTMAIAVFDGIFAAMFYSLWYGALAVYYAVLVAMRSGVLLKSYNTKRRVKGGLTEEHSEATAYRTCGILLIVLTLALSGVILQLARDERSFSKPGFTIYVFAVYTVCKIAISLYNFFKSKQYRGYVNILRNISFADALVSLLALQTALLAQFGSGAVNAARLNAFTGNIIGAFIFGMGISMIVRGRGDSGKYDEENEESLGGEE